jgi:hypothetical protein
LRNSPQPASNAPCSQNPKHKLLRGLLEEEGKREGSHNNQKENKKKIIRKPKKGLPVLA